jgi:hypothetical protein
VTHRVGLAARILLTAFLVGAAASPVASQIPNQTTLPTNPRQQGQRRTNRDSLYRDSVMKERARDSTHRIIKWEEPDSAEASLMDRPDYSVTRYQGQNAQFDANTRALQIEGHVGEQLGRGAVDRDSTLIIGDTIVYNDSLQIVNATGDTIYLHDPKNSENGDVVSLGSVKYDVVAHTAIVNAVHTEYVAQAQRWYITANRGAYAGDTTGKGASAFYGRDGDVTTCDDSFPHYHISGGELKYVSKHILVIRPAVLYIADVPILWLPFIFQDLRTGRRSGILTPRFGFNEIIRNSATYRRNFSNLGYYFDINDYMDYATWIDWRSAARPQPGDPGYWQFNGEFRYKWLDRFVQGDLAAQYRTESDGTTNLSIYWQHQQDFNAHTHLQWNINYVTSTQDQESVYLNPYSVLATINSQVAYQTTLGPSSVSIGGTQTQYPGRTELDRTFPTLTLTTKPITLGKWLTWTPSFSASNQQSYDIDNGGYFSYIYSSNLLGQVDSTTLNRNTRNTTASFTTPIKILGFTWNNSFTLQDQENDFPGVDNIYVPGKTASGADTTFGITRVFAKTYATSLDWQTGISLPTISQGKWNIVPSVSVVNDDPSAPFLKRSELSGLSWETQGKRLVYGLQFSPTFYGLFNGALGVSRIRNSITPLLTFNYSPAVNVSNTFLLANGQNPVGYLGNLAQESITLGVSTNIEAKLRDGPDTNPANGTKIKVASISFDPITYDFERAAYTHSTGLTTDSWGYSVRSDLLPGFDFRETWSLFQGSSLSDTAVFSPYPTQISASLSFGHNSNPLTAFAKILGLKTTVQKPNPDSVPGQRDPFFAQQLAAAHVAGQSAQSAQYNIPTSGQPGGWLLSLTFNETQQRPPVGNLSNVVQYNPATYCSYLQQTQPVLYAACLLQKRNTSIISDTSNSINGTTAGATFVRIPPQTSLAASLALNITPRWSVQWQTTYDVTIHNFASNVVTLQRDLHDWRAVFSFTQSPTGSFGFTFFVALKAEPALKFNYDRTSFRAPPD